MSQHPPPASRSVTSDVLPRSALLSFPLGNDIAHFHPPPSRFAMLRAFSYRSLVLATAIALAPFALNAQATASVTCKDGTTSAATGRGACSGHGGVDKSAKASRKSAKADT